MFVASRRRVIISRWAISTTITWIGVRTCPGRLFGFMGEARVRAIVMGRGLNVMSVSRAICSGIVECLGSGFRIIAGDGCRCGERWRT